MCRSLKTSGFEFVTTLNGLKSAAERMGFPCVIKPVMSSSGHGGRRKLPYVFTEQGVFYDGQVFDAYIFTADLIKSANKSILLIDNYVDETVLQLLTKRKKKVTATIYTKNISKVLKQDMKKHNSQYPKIDIEIFTKAHDRFLIIDETTVYHFGASLKDLGKKWFAFSKMDMEAMEMIANLRSLSRWKVLQVN